MNSANQLKGQIRRKKGFSLIEAAIVLGIVGLVIGGIWVAASAVQTNLRESTASQGILQIVQNVRNLYYGQTVGATTTGTGLEATLVAAGVFPGDMLQGSTPKNPWNGTLQVNISDTTNGYFQVYFPTIPQGSCIELISQNTNIASGIGLVNIIVDDGTAATISTFPISPATAAGAGGCGAATNNVTWTFNLKG